MVVLFLFRVVYVYYIIWHICVHIITRTKHRKGLQNEVCYLNRFFLYFKIELTLQNSPNKDVFVLFGLDRVRASSCVKINLLRDIAKRQNEWPSLTATISANTTIATSEKCCPP